MIPAEATAVNAYLRLHIVRDGGGDLVVSVPALVSPEVFRELSGEVLQVEWLELVRA